LSDWKIAEKIHKKFIEEYLSDKLFFYNATDTRKIPLREKPVKIEIREPINPSILKQQKEMLKCVCINSMWRGS
jgi:hypothetical protein